MMHILSKNLNIHYFLYFSTSNRIKYCDNYIQVDSWIKRYAQDVKLLNIYIKRQERRMWIMLRLYQ